jgi:hypothetical protein
MDGPFAHDEARSQDRVPICASPELVSQEGSPRGFDIA